MTTTFEPPVLAQRGATRATQRYRVLARVRQHSGLWVMALYAVIAWLADFPIWPGDPHQVPSELGGDIVQTAWFLEWTPYAILHGHNPFYSNWINFPQGADIAQNTGMQLLALVSAPLTLLVSPVASENLLRFLAFTLSAYAGYWVLRQWTSYLPAAFVGGLIYGFSPYMVSQGEYHLNLIFVPFPPLILFALFELIVTQQRSAKRWGVLLGVFAVCQFYISAEVLATTALIAGIGCFYIFFLGFRYVPDKYAHALVGLAIAGVVVAPLIAYPVFELIRGQAHYTGPAQGFNNVYNADLLGPLIPTKDMLVAPERLSQIGTSLVGAQIQENGSYLGVPLLALTIYFVVRNWRRLWPLFLSLMALSAFVLSLGPLLVIDGKTYKLPVDLPFRKLAHLPIIESILPVRLSLYVVFFVAVIVALGIDGLWNDHLARLAALGEGARRVNALSLSHVLAALVAILSLVALLPRWPYRTLPVSAGVHYSETAKGMKVIPEGTAVLTYPYPTSFFDMAMFWQALDHMHFKLLGSYALVPDSTGAATIFPAVLRPSDVEAMLVNSVTEVSDPDLADLVATAKSITASRVVVLPPGTITSRLRAPLIGRVGSVNRLLHTFYVYPNHFDPVAVHFSAATRYVESGARYPSIAGIALGQRVEIYGKVGPGTVTPLMVRSLRTYLRVNHVGAVIVGLGITDANEVGNWFRLALGKPTRAGGGAEIWTNVAQIVR